MKPEVIEKHLVIEAGATVVSSIEYSMSMLTYRILEEIDAEKCSWKVGNVMHHCIRCVC